MTTTIDSELIEVLEFLNKRAEWLRKTIDENGKEIIGLHAANEKFREEYKEIIATRLYLRKLKDQ